MDDRSVRCLLVSGHRRQVDVGESVGDEGHATSKKNYRPSTHSIRPRTEETEEDAARQLSDARADRVEGHEFVGIYGEGLGERKRRRVDSRPADSSIPLNGNYQ